MNARPAPAQARHRSTRVARRVERPQHGQGRELARHRPPPAEQRRRERRVTFLEKDPDLPPAREANACVDPRPPREKPAKKPAPRPPGQAPDGRRPGPGRSPRPPDRHGRGSGCGDRLQLRLGATPNPWQLRHRVTAHSGRAMTGQDEQRAACCRRPPPAGTTCGQHDVGERRLRYERCEFVCRGVARSGCSGLLGLSPTTD